MALSTTQAPEALLEHAVFVRAVARAVLYGDDLVDDAVQETWVAALERDETRRGPLRPWLGGIARRTALRLLRRRIRDRRCDRASARDEALPGVDEMAARAEVGRRVVDAVLALDEPYRTVLLLRYHGEIPPKRVAEHLGLPHETVRTQLKRGLRQLRARLAASQGDARNDWRAGLLPLAFGPGPATGTMPSLLATTTATGGGLVVKKIAVVAVLAALILGPWLWKQWAPPAEAPVPGDAPAAGTLAESADRPDAPQLVGRAAKGAAYVERLPPPVDLEAADRQRDLCGVVLGEGDLPVPGASVRIVRHPWRDGGLVVEPALYQETRIGPAARTARDGTFAFRLTPGDLVYLLVEAKGYTPVERTRLQAGERTVIRLRRGVRLVVRVTTAAGKPAGDVGVLLYPGGSPTQLTFEREGTTDAEGRMTFDDLPAMETVRVFLFPRHEGQAAPTTTAMPIVELPEQGEVVHEVQLIEGWILRGTVADARTARPVPGATVSIWWNQLGGVQTDEEGRYALPGASAHPMLAVHVVAEGYARTVRTLEGARTLDLTLQPGHEIAGRVVDAKGQPVVGALLRVIGSRSPQRVRDMLLAAGVSGEGGLFSVGGLARDVPHTLIVKAAGHGKTLVDFDPPRSGDSVDLGEVRLSAPCTVTGRILAPDGLPLPHTDVEVVGWNADRTRLRPGATGPIGSYYGTQELRRSDDLGRFRATDLSPGTYVVRVQLESQQPIEQEVTLTEAAPTAEVDLVLRVVRPYRVRVVDDGGAPVADVLVRIQEGSGRIVDEDRTDDDGEVQFTLPRRTFDLAVYPRSAAPYATPPRRAVRSRDTETEVRLEAAVVLRGRLVDAEGKPILLGYVTAIREERWTVMSQDEGRFALRLPPGGPVRLRFEGRFRDRDGPARLYCRPLLAELESVPAGAQDVLLRAQPMPEDRALAVRLLGPDGSPMAGTTLSVTWARPGKPGAQLVSDAKGRARFEGLPAIPLNVFPAWVPSREQPWVLPTMEPVVPDGQEVEIRLRPGVLLEGEVTGEDVGSGSEGKVYVRAVDPVTNVSKAWSHVDAEGRFALVFRPEEEGPFRVIAQRYDPKGGVVYEAIRDGVRPRDAPLALALKLRRLGG